jgi:arsenite methyltransferase
MTQLEFDDEASRLLERFNDSRGAKARRARIMSALAPAPGAHVLDVGCGPGHQVHDLALVVGATGTIVGVDVAESAVAIAKRRCSNVSNVSFELGEATQLPFPKDQFDGAMSSQTFEYLDDVPAGLKELYRVLKPGGRVLIHDTDWGATFWHAEDSTRMSRISKAWDAHLANPQLPRTLGRSLAEAGFSAVKVEAIVQLETRFEPDSLSAILTRFVGDYVTSQSITRDDVDAWAEELQNLNAGGSYFYSSNEYIFTAIKEQSGC